MAPKRSGTIRRCGFAEVGVALRKGVTEGQALRSYAQTLLYVNLSLLPEVYISTHSSYLSSPMSAGKSHAML